MTTPPKSAHRASNVSATGRADGVWTMTRWAWVALVGAIALVCAVSFESLKYMVQLWAKEEYGYAYIIPAVTAFMIWQKKDALERLPFEGTWAGITIVLVGLALILLGELSTLFIVVQYAVLIVIAGLALTFMGWRGFRQIWVPLLLLAFMIPLPDFLYRSVSAQSQLISSQIGVAIIRLFGIPVLLEGNVIDLGSYKLQVQEACNGLRYLFPLMALGFIAAYFFKGPLWKRAIIFVSTVPITILMNSFRIGIIGIMVERWGRSMAEGFLHDFEGWAIFMTCTAVLVAEMWLLARIGPVKRSLRDVFSVDLPAAAATDTPVRLRSIPRPFMGALVVVVLASLTFAALPQRAESPLQRKDFSQFPVALGKWQGKTIQMEATYLDVLKLDDYVFADYVSTNRRPVNFYVAYYASQRKGDSAHSPRACIPGGGWEITDLTERRVDGVTIAGEPLRVNRVIIQKGNDEQLVYYWFQQRGRVITNEYLVKWYLFWDALTRNRTDGALVRLMIDVNPGRNVDEAEKQLISFVGTVAGRLPDYVPD
jgi:exosortase D (VPLPA-CTERM-specific)